MSVSTLATNKTTPRPADLRCPTPRHVKPDAPKKDASNYGHRLTVNLRHALNDAELNGVPRKEIARRLGIKLSRIEAWVSPSKPDIIGGAFLMRLKSDEGVLPETSRRLFNQLQMREAGFIAISLADLDVIEPRSLSLGLCSMVSDMGQVADTIQMAIADGVVDAGERKLIRSRVFALASDCATLLAQIDESDEVKP